MSDSIPPLPPSPLLYQWEDWKTKDLRNACERAAPRAFKKYLRSIREIMHNSFEAGARGGGAGIMARARMPLAGVYRRLCSMQRGTRAYFSECEVFASGAG